MRRFSFLSVLLLGTLTAFLTGCSKSPVAPISTTMDGGASTAGLQTGDDPSDVDGGMPASVTTQVLPSEEGQLTVGRFTLDLHKNTLKMPATITMRVASADAMEVEITVTPAEANDFQVQADLTTDMRDQPNADLSNMTVFEWDSDLWQEVSGTSPHSNRCSLVSKLNRARNSAVAEKKNSAEATRGPN